MKIDINILHNNYYYYIPFMYQQLRVQRQILQSLTQPYICKNSAKIAMAVDNCSDNLRAYMSAAAAFNGYFLKTEK